MKKIASVIVSALLIIALFAGCSGNKDSKKTQTADKKMPTVLNTTEYQLYQNIFYNDQKNDYDGKETSKEGTFATVIDAYSNVERYYVWGYNDNTKCCDWQWELKIDDTSKLPTNGSLITVKGTYEVNDSALDGLWIVNPEISVKTEFKERDYDIDMLSMGNTLERVQAANIVNIKEKFEGKTICCYGRVLDEKTLQDAYYDGSWTIGFSGDFEPPAFGTTILVFGTVKDGALVDCSIAENTQY